MGKYLYIILLLYSFHFNCCDDYSVLNDQLMFTCIVKWHWSFKTEAALLRTPKCCTKDWLHDYIIRKVRFKNFLLLDSTCYFSYVSLLLIVCSLVGLILCKKCGGSGYSRRLWDEVSAFLLCLSANIQFVSEA